MTPIAPFMTTFLREHMPIERGYSPNTCETYAHTFRLLFEFASGRLEKRPSQLCIEHITTALVLDFLRHIEKARSNSSVTRKSRLAAVKAFMRYVELRVPSSLEQVHQIRAIPTKRHDQAWFNTLL
jgi:site-specific recombinase XerD